MITRFFDDIFGSTPLAIIEGILTDFRGPVERGFALSFFSGVIFIRSIAGPIMGGFITQNYLG